MVKSISLLKPKLVDGIPEYDIPSLEPIDLGELIVPGSRTGQGVSISIRDIRAFGASDFNLTTLK